MCAKWTPILLIAENVMRADLSPVEEARFFQARLAEGLTQVALGERIGKSQQYIADRLALLRLADDVQGLITARAVSPSIGRMLSGLDAETQSFVANVAAEEGLTVAATRNLISSIEEIDRSYRHMADAFRTIHDKNLYREYGTWESYCEQRWQMNASEAQRILLLS